MDGVRVKSLGKESLPHPKIIPIGTKFPGLGDQQKKEDDLNESGKNSVFFDRFEKAINKVC